MKKLVLILLLIAIASPVWGVNLSNLLIIDEALIDDDIARDSELPDAASLSVDDLWTLMGITEGLYDFGSMFTGSTIPDDSNISESLQALETAVEASAGGHDAVTIGTANGLSLSTQELSLAAATNATPGAATAAHIAAIEANTAKETNTDAQDLTLTGNTLAISGDPNDDVDLSGYLDNTDNQTIDALSLNGTTLNISLEGDGEENQTVDLSGLQDGTGTDDQTAAEVTVADTEEDFTGENVETVLHEIQDTIDTLPGGHDAVTLNASAITAGLSLNTQELSYQAATNAQNGYMTSAMVQAVEANNGKVTYPGYAFATAGDYPASSNTMMAPDTAKTYFDTIYAISGGAFHDGFSDFVANEHIDWTTDQGATNIHSGNYTDTNTTYSAGTGLTLTGTEFSLTNTPLYSTDFGTGVGKVLEGDTTPADIGAQPADADLDKVSAFNFGTVNAIMVWDATDGELVNPTLSGIEYDHATHTLSSSGGRLDSEACIYYSFGTAPTQEIIDAYSAIGCDHLIWQDGSDISSSARIYTGYADYDVLSSAHASTSGNVGYLAYCLDGTFYVSSGVDWKALGVTSSTTTLLNETFDNLDNWSIATHRTPATGLPTISDGKAVFNGETSETILGAEYAFGTDGLSGTFTITWSEQVTDADHCDGRIGVVTETGEWYGIIINHLTGIALRKNNGSTTTVLDSYATIDTDNNTYTATFNRNTGSIFVYQNSLLILSAGDNSYTAFSYLYIMGLGTGSSNYTYIDGMIVAQ